MPFKIKFADITKYEGDAIVNSIGVNGSVKGALCKAILKEANSKELTSFIDSKINNKIGEMFVTKGYNLFSKNIIHVVSPFKADDDKDNTNLKNIYKSIINMAIKLGYKKIAIPFLGTGANGYLDSDAYNCISKVCASLVKHEEEIDKDILTVTLIVRGNQHLIQYQQYKDYCEESGETSKRIYEDVYFENKKMSPGEEESTSNIEGNKLRKNSIKCIRFLSSLNPRKFFTPAMLPYNAEYDFIDDYVYQYNINDKVLAKDGFDRRVKGKMRKGQKLKKIDIYRFAFSLKMDKEVIVQLMMMCNHSFNPNEPLDMFYIDYLEGKYPNVSTLVDLSLLSYDKCKETLLW